jgi:hypothetical protein
MCLKTQSSSWLEQTRNAHSFGEKSLGKQLLEGMVDDIKKLGHWLS